MSFTDQSISVLSMGVRSHEAILQPFSADIAKIMKKHDWTCSRCGIRIPNLMQIDHSDGHAARDSSGFLPICQFCHDQDHLIWSASCRRLVPIIATTPHGVISNEEISLLGWSMVSMFSHRETDADAHEALAGIVSAFSRRRVMFQERFGTKDADSFIEAVFRFLDGTDQENDKMRAERSRIVAQTLAIVRFIPSFIAGDTSEDNPASFLSTWGPGGFSSIQVTDPGKLFPLQYQPADLVSGVKDLLSRNAEV